MANAEINYGDFNYATGNKIILQYIADYIVMAQRNRGNPLRKFTNVSNTLASNGDVARVQVTATTASNTLTDGNTRVLDDTVDTTVDITMSTQRYNSYGVTDMAKLLSGDVEAASLFEGRWAGLMNDIESDFMALFTTGSTTNVVGTYGTAITEANFSTLASKLLTQKPPKTPFHFFTSPLGYSQISQIANYNSGSVRGYLPGEPSPLLERDYGDASENTRPWHNCYIHSCNSVVETSVSGNGNTINVMASPASVAIAMRPLDTGEFGGSSGYIAVPFVDADAGVAGSVVYAKNFQTFASEITVRALYGFGIVKEVWTGLLLS